MFISKPHIYKVKQIHQKISGNNNYKRKLALPVFHFQSTLSYFDLRFFVKSFWRNFSWNWFHEIFQRRLLVVLQVNYTQGAPIFFCCCFRDVFFSVPCFTLYSCGLKINNWLLLLYYFVNKEWVLCKKYPNLIPDLKKYELIIIATFH